MSREIVAIAWWNHPTARRCLTKKSRKPQILIICMVRRSKSMISPKTVLSVYVVRAWDDYSFKCGAQLKCHSRSKAMPFTLRLGWKQSPRIDTPHKNDTLILVGFLLTKTNKIKTSYFNDDKKQSKRCCVCNKGENGCAHMVNNNNNNNILYWYLCVFERGWFTFTVAWGYQTWTAGKTLQSPPDEPTARSLC